MYKPLAFALTKDALTNGGPGQVNRLDLSAVCNEAVALELDLADVLTTEEGIVIAGVSVVAYPDKVTEEPLIMSYAA